MSDNLRDPHLDALWRAASREEPPAALDAKLLAAAHREVHSVPRVAEAEVKVAEATRPERWWWPLAAAATIGAVAFGVLQLQPVEPNEPAVVSDIPPRNAARSNAGGKDAFVPDPETRQGTRPHATAAAPGAVQGPVQEAAQGPAEPAQRKAQETPNRIREQSSLADGSARTPAPSPVFRSERQRAAAENKLAAQPEADPRSASVAPPPSEGEGTARGKKQSKPAPESDAMGRTDSGVPGRAPARAPSAAPPAAAPSVLAAGDDKMAFAPPPPAAVPAPSTPAAVPPPLASVPAPSTPAAVPPPPALVPPPSTPAADALARANGASAGLARKEAAPGAAQKIDAERRASPGAAQKIEAERRASSGAVQKQDVEAAPSAGESTQSATPPRDAASSALVARSAPGSAAPGKDAVPSAPLAKARVAGSSDRSEGVRAALPVAEWIALIRRLRAEGRIDEAGKELAAFRSAHPGDAERLLPQDLREWRPITP